MSTFWNLWPKFRRGKEYREEFAAQCARQAVPLQISALMKQHGLTQKQLAARSGVTQGVISRAADPSYGKLTLRTLTRIAAGFDVAFIGLFVPFTALPKWFDRLEREGFTVSSFAQEDDRITRADQRPSLTDYVRSIRDTQPDIRGLSLHMPPLSLDIGYQSPLQQPFSVPSSSETPSNVCYSPGVESQITDAGAQVAGAGLLLKHREVSNA